MTNFFREIHNLVARTRIGKKVFILINFPVHKFRNIYFRRKILNGLSTERKFTWIYHQNFWNSEESVSGGGSTLKYTENLRKQLPELIRDFSVKTVFDAPCGDFNWMSSIIRQLNVQYTGGDIVRPLIDNHNIKYRNNKTKFIQINLIKDEFPRADLMICRDCLFHLSYNDIRGVLQNYVESGIPLLLTTTHINESGFENRDIKTGDVRMIDLFSSPFNLSPEPLARIDDWVQPYPMRQMCLWNRNQIIECLEQLQRNSN